jgi:DNA-binding transcriptional ArsR family regulator
MTTITAAKADSLLAELVERFTIPQLDESCEVCASMIAERSGLNSDMVTRQLKELTKAGELVEHPAIWRGRRVTAYRRSDGTQS